MKFSEVSHDICSIQARKSVFYSLLYAGFVVNDTVCTRVSCLFFCIAFALLLVVKLVVAVGRWLSSSVL